MSDGDDTYGQLPPDAEVWHFPAKPHGGISRSIVDGDTLDLDFDLGMRTRASDQRIRLYGVDTAEVFGVLEDSDEYRRGTDHAAFVEAWIDRAERMADDYEEWYLRCYTLKGKGKYGRWLADVLNVEGNSLVAALYDEFGDEVAYGE